jgi:glycine cleavage system H lipoate-binding protein/ABC-type phosphate transport system substrate-binding protein
MKKVAFLFAILLLLTISFSYGETNESGSASSGKGTIQVLSTPELYNLTSIWAEEYTGLNPGVKISVLKNQDWNIGDFLASGSEIGFVSGDVLHSTGSNPEWRMTVGRDVIVPVVSAKNPFADELYQNGVTAEELSRVIGDSGNRIWGTLLGSKQQQPVHLYILNNETVIASLRNFIKINEIPGEDIYYMEGKELVSSIQDDPYAIGICKLNNIRSIDQTGIMENIRFLPIDKNGNGNLDYMENIYSNLDHFTRGVWIGKYPKTLYHDVYCIAGSQPSNAEDIAFLRWILTTGQKFLPQNGLCDLVYGERQSKLARFDEINIVMPSSKPFYFLTPLVFIIVASIVIISLLISVIVYHRKRLTSTSGFEQDAVPVNFSGNSVDIPKGLYYDKTHTWAFMEKDGTVKIGIDDFLQHVTGRITGIQMRRAGEKIRKGDMILTIIQNGKRLIVHSPVSGTVIDNNKLLSNNSSIINSSPYSDGWIYRIEPGNWFREIKFLDIAEKYRVWLDEEFSRLKDFLARSLKVDKTEYESVILQDGGVLKDNILEAFGPEVWEDFQAHFLDVAS